MLWVGFVLGRFSLILNKNKANPVQFEIFVWSRGALKANEGPENVCLKCKKCERSKSQLYLPLNSALVTYSRTIFYRKSFPQIISWFDSSRLIGWTLPWVKLFRRFPGSVVSVEGEIARKWRLTSLGNCLLPGGVRFLCYNRSVLENVESDITSLHATPTASESTRCHNIGLVHVSNRLEENKFPFLCVNCCSLNIHPNRF